ncbi:MAG: Na-translocating system protein MpsC family protein, partial [Planctomycetota bacterium]|nr:Na-translocating system protein MpsC family protein [Planctomycetota bacterium]
KQLRRELLEGARPLLEVTIKDIIGVPVQSLHTDISTKTGERIIVFTLAQQPKWEG